MAVFQVRISSSQGCGNFEVWGLQAREEFIRTMIAEIIFCLEKKLLKGVLHQVLEKQ